MRRILAIGLLGLVMINMTGVYIYFRAHQAHIRHEIKQKIKAGVPQEELHVFRFSKKEFQSIDWVRPNKEFSVNGQMYDVVRRQNSYDTILLHCVNDSQETRLFTVLDQMVDRQMGMNARSKENRRNFNVGGSYIYLLTNNLPILDLTETTGIEQFGPEMIYSEPWLSIVDPPPLAACAFS